MKNLVLVGMPSAGKSTLGVLLAKQLGYGFVDTDLLIQKNTGHLLSEILLNHGVEALRQAEEDAILGLHTSKAVIATGGSAVYSDKAMTHLKQNGVVLHLGLAYEVVEKRIGDMDARGIARTPGQTLLDLYEERRPLYLQYADITVDTTGLGVEDAVREIKRQIPV